MNVSNNQEPIYLELYSGSLLLTLMADSTAMSILDKTNSLCLYFNQDIGR